METETEFDYWREKLQNEVKDCQKKIKFLEGVNYGILIQVTARTKSYIHHQRAVYLMKFILMAESVNAVSIIGSPVAVNDQKYNTAFKGLFTLNWTTIQKMKIFHRKDLPLLLEWKLYPLFDKLLKGEK